MDHMACTCTKMRDATTEGKTEADTSPEGTPSMAWQFRLNVYPPFARTFAMITSQSLVQVRRHVVQGQDVRFSDEASIGDLVVIDFAGMVKRLTCFTVIRVEFHRLETIDAKPCNNQQGEAILDFPRPHSPRGPLWGRWRSEEKADNCITCLLLSGPALCLFLVLTPNDMSQNITIVDLIELAINASGHRPVPQSSTACSCHGTCNSLAVECGSSVVVPVPEVSHKARKVGSIDMAFFLHSLMRIDGSRLRWRLLRNRQSCSHRCLLSQSYRNHPVR